MCTGPCRALAAGVREREGVEGRSKQSVSSVVESGGETGVSQARRGDFEVLAPLADVQRLLDHVVRPTLERDCRGYGQGRSRCHFSGKEAGASRDEACDASCDGANRAGRTGRRTPDADVLDGHVLKCVFVERIDDAVVQQRPVR